MEKEEAILLRRFRLGNLDNVSPEIIEAHGGGHLGEDGIVRFEDRFSRQWDQ